MKIIVKNKFVSWGGSSKVEDENGKPLYNVKGKAFSWTRKKILKDLNGNVLYIIKNKWPTFIMHSAYICDSRGNKLCKVKETIKRDTLYKVEESRDNIEFHGYLISGMAVRRNGENMGTIKKEFWALRDYFVLNIPEGQDPTFMIALAIALDNIQDKSKSQSN